MTSYSHTHTVWPPGPEYLWRRRCQINDRYLDGIDTDLKSASSMFGSAGVDHSNVESQHLLFTWPCKHASCANEDRLGCLGGAPGSIFPNLPS